MNKFYIIEAYQHPFIHKAPSI